MPVRYAGIAMLALLVLCAATPAFADSINLLSPAAAQIDDDCSGLSDTPSSSTTPHGLVRWNFGLLAWDWDPEVEASLTSIPCMDPKREIAPLGGAMPMMAAMAWPGAHSSTRTVDTRAQQG